jgi:hypothetical protein
MFARITRLKAQGMQRILLALLIALVLGHPAVAKDQSFNTLAGGDVSGNYFATASAMKGGMCWSMVENSIGQQ